MTAVKFVGGDEVVEPFLIEDSSGDILDISGLTITASVWWRERLRIDLNVDSGGGIEIVNNFPARSDDPATQEPHGYVTLSEAQTTLMPFGAVSSLRIQVVTAGVVTMSTYLASLERVP